MTETLENLLPEESTILVKGQPFTKLPEDLYIPPEALEVFLDAFSGPLDLLLYLIRKHNIDILDIPVFEITKQYMMYVEMMTHFKLSLAADYLLMAATLAEIKSKMLLPRHGLDSSGYLEIDLRMALIRRLQEYEKFKQAAENLAQLPQVGRDIFVVPKQAFEKQEKSTVIVAPNFSAQELVSAFMTVLKNSALLATHKIHQEPLSVRARMSVILDSLSQNTLMVFSDCFNLSEGRLGIVVSFIAILELIKEGLLDIVQAEPFAPIHLKRINADA